MGMSNNKNFIALPGGETCKQLITEQIGPETHKTFINSPTYALTEVMPEGETFSGVEVWQTRNSNDGDWFNCPNNTPTFLKDHPKGYRQAIKPLKAIEPVNSVDSDYIQVIKCEGIPLADVVENKETVEEPECPVCGHPYASSTHRQECRDHAVGPPPPLLPLLPDQSIEGIVGFALEWVVKKLPTSEDYANHSEDDIKSWKSDIIKEYNNGK